MQAGPFVRPGIADDAKLADYYFRAVHDVTVAAKQLVQGYFGRPLAKSYFDGCSNGGRQALVEASRYPEDYDGVIAGAPFMDIKAIPSRSWLMNPLALLALDPQPVGDHPLPQCLDTDMQTILGQFLGGKRGAEIMVTIADQAQHGLAESRSVGPLAAHRHHRHSAPPF